MSRPDTWLSDDEVAGMTGKVRPSAQARWLAANSYTFEVSGNGKILVLRSHMERKQGGEIGQKRKTAPRLDMVN